MFITKNLSLKGVLAFTGGHLLWISAWTIFISMVYMYTHWEWMAIPWLPLSVIGTAVAFYVGFKNNQAYDRLWEARIIWGGIVNSSRMWGSTVKAFVTNQFADKKASTEELKNIHQKLIYTHLAWLYTLRNQLLIPTPWEHISQGFFARKSTSRKMRMFGVGLHDDDITEKMLRKLLAGNECTKMFNYKNTATQIIDMQSNELKVLRERNLIDDFRHMELQNILNEFYALQGKCERIKKFPLPRQYGGMSLIFVVVFILLLPFGMVPEFHKMGHLGHFLSIPFTILISWIYITMELVGDYSENPFEGLGNDVPMLSLVRTIEIDLREMLGETDLPPGIEAINGVLM